jgi:hypothetical protein
MAKPTGLSHEPLQFLQGEAISVRPEVQTLPWTRHSVHESVEVTALLKDQPSHSRRNATTVGFGSVHQQTAGNLLDPAGLVC